MVTPAELARLDALLERLDENALVFPTSDVSRLLAESAEMLREMAAEIAAASVEEERLHMQAAACMTACLQNTRESAKERIGRDNPYWTQAYADVCTAVDREMDLRDRLAAERDYIKRMDAVIDDAGIALSCINPLEDLKRAVQGMKDRLAAVTAERTSAINMLKFAACPNSCTDGMIINTGPDPQYDPCDFCMHREMLIDAARAASEGKP